MKNLQQSAIFSIFTGFSSKTLTLLCSRPQKPQVLAPQNFFSSFFFEPPSIDLTPIQMPQLYALSGRRIRQIDPSVPSTSTNSIHPVKSSSEENQALAIPPTLLRIIGAPPKTSFNKVEFLGKIL